MFMIVSNSGDSIDGKLYSDEDEAIEQMDELQEQISETNLSIKEY